MLRWLGQRELSASQARLRLRRRHYADDTIATAVAGLVADGVLDDGRAARARARHDVAIKRQGRGRVLRQVQSLGVDDDTARAAVAAAFEDVDEDRLLADALIRRLRGQPLPSDRKALGRLYGWLVRQGFDAGKVSALFRRGGRDTDGT
ncbi:MAG: RecX family transcriptional regulator [Vicinamibacteria bacterium]|nr:RecX family transcriptional regulator [Vicinamibacteria bacterium]